MYFPESGPICTRCGLRSAQAIWVKEGSEAADKAVERRDAFGLKGMLDKHIIIHRKYLNRILARCFDQPTGEFAVWILIRNFA